MKKKICFDLDGTLCTNTWGKYKEAQPIEEAIKKVNELYDDNFEIVIWFFICYSQQKQKGFFLIGPLCVVCTFFVFFGTKTRGQKKVWLFWGILDGEKGNWKAKWKETIGFYQILI